MDQNDFTEAYSLTTGLKQRIPAHWLDDPVLGRDFAKTPSQRELDGELGPRPTEDSTVKEIEKYAEKADIDLDSSATKTEKLTAIEAVFSQSDDQAGLVPIEPAPPAGDPLAPALVAAIDPAVTTDDPSDAVSPAADTNTDTPADGDKEN